MIFESTESLSFCNPWARAGSHQCELFSATVVKAKSDISGQHDLLNTYLSTDNHESRFKLQKKKKKKTHKTKDMQNFMETTKK